MSTFLSSYDAHVAERAEMADGHGVAPQPLTAAQVTDLIDEIKAGGGGDADKVRTVYFEITVWSDCMDFVGWHEKERERDGHKLCACSECVCVYVSC